MKPRTTLRLAGLSGSYRTLLPRLPKNLAVIDGHCLWCQSRMQYVLERNFSFFHFRSVLYEDPKAAASRLRQHALYFASLDSSEGRELIHRFFTSSPKKSTPSRSNSSSSTFFPSTRLPLPEDLAVLFIEKVHARQFYFLRQQGARLSHENNDDLLFRKKDSSDGIKRKKNDPVGPQPLGQKNPSSSPLFSSSFPLPDEDVYASPHDPSQVDLFISVNFSALCRMGMHLDRFFPRMLSCILYYTVPEWVGSKLFHHFVTRRRQFIWGTSEEDAVVVLDRVEGMKERRWRWRTTYKR